MKILRVTQLVADRAPKTFEEAPKGMTLSIYLQPHRSQKKGGHPVVIRATYAKKHVYLPTELYAEQKEFNDVKKVLINQEKQEKLDRYYALAVTLAVELGQDIEAIKAAWVKRRNGAAEEKKILSFVERHEHYQLDEMLEERERLERELAELNEQIALYSANLKRSTRKPSATEGEKQQFKDALQEFRTTWQLLNKRDAQAWESWVNILEEAAKAEKKPLTLGGMNLDFYAAYAKHILYTRDNYDNTFGAHVKRLKSFLKFAEEHGYPVNPTYKDKRFKITSEEKEVIYLDETEMNLLWEFAGNNPFLTKAIHLATFQNLTGLRVSDVMKKHVVSKEQGNEFLKGITTKNKGAYTIPLALDARIKQILEEYNYDLNIISPKHYNEQLKKAVAATYAHNGMEMPIVEIRPTKLGVAFPYYNPKNEELGSHSMRRSFCTRHINGTDFNQNDILKMLGSKDLKELQKYMQVETTSLVTKALNASRG